MKLYRALIIVFCVLFLSRATAQKNMNIIPVPAKMEPGNGEFVFNNCTRLHFDRSNQKLHEALSPLIGKFRKAASINLLSAAKCSMHSIVKVTISNSIPGEEEYSLQVSDKKIEIIARRPAGVFYAVQSLLQLLPANIESTLPVKNIKWKAQAVKIEDAPRFVYRGIMLDVSRHYMTVDSVKRIINLLSMQKMNRLHWHLTDNDAWRFESKKYPRLTEIGAYRKGSPVGNNVTYDYASLPNEKLYGGFYSQKEMKDIVQYAQKRFITIVPEIEMPAHAEAAIAAYPFLSCLDKSGNEFPYPQDIQGEFCTKDETFAFLTDILSEVMEIFPGKYIHIGGDEAEKANWKTCRHCVKRMKDEGLANVHELQSYFIKRIEKFVNSKGRSIIGWDEIMEGGVAPNAAIMSWTGIKNGKEAAEKDHHVVMTPLPYCYFDHYQSDDPAEPVTYSGLTMLSNVYGFEPVPEGLAPEKQKYISGAQGNLWTEYVPAAKKAEYMIFPRSTALAEVTWSKPEHKNYRDFINRLYAYNKRLDFHHVNYSKHMFDIRLSNMSYENGKFVVRASVADTDDKIYYTVDGSRPNLQSPVYNSAIQINKSCMVTAAIIKDGEITDLSVKKYVLHKGVGKKGTVQIPAGDNYNKAGIDGWHNGSLSDDTRKNDLRYMDEHRYNSDQWSGWYNQQFNGTIDLEKQERIENVSIRFYHNVPHGILIPKSVSVQTSDDGVNFKNVATQTVTRPEVTGTATVKFAVGANARYVRVIAEPYGKTPRGNYAWLFVDEVIVE